MMQKLGAEFIGTFTLVLCGCGAAVLAAPGLLSVALAFGLAFTAMSYAISHLSGGYYNPAVTVAMAINNRFSWRDVLPYIIAQVAGAVAGAGIVYLIISSKGGVDATMLASNGFGSHSPGGFDLHAAILTEIVLTALFVMVCLGATSNLGALNFAPLVIGLSLTVMILVAGNVTGGSINPARSTGSAIISGGWAFDQLWVFWLAPLLGAVVGGYVYKWAICCGSCGNKDSFV